MSLILNNSIIKNRLPTEYMYDWTGPMMVLMLNTYVMHLSNSPHFMYLSIHKYIFQKVHVQMYLTRLD